MHLADSHYGGCPDLSKDKLVLLGNILKQIYEAKLKWQFTDKPCKVEFYIPDNQDDLGDYQISFWQLKHETNEPI